MRSDVEEAIALLQSGDNAATERALDLLQNTVFSFSMRVCGQREDAEDTMQDVLLKSVPYLPKFDNPKALVVWLYKVAKNRCLMNRRRSKFAPAQELSLDALMPDRKELEELGAGGVNPEMFVIRSEEAALLRSAIQKLPPHYRIVLVLRDMEGLTDEEVAEVTGLRPATVRVRLHRARLFVRKDLMKIWKKRPATTITAATQSLETAARPARCKALFAALSDYLDERLDDSLCEDLEKHFEGCEPCKVFLTTLQSTIEQLRTTSTESPAPQNAGELRRKLLAAYEALLAKADRQ